MKFRWERFPVSVDPVPFRHARIPARILRDLSTSIDRKNFLCSYTSTKHGWKAILWRDTTWVVLPCIPRHLYQVCRPVGVTGAVSLVMPRHREMVALLEHRTEFLWWWDGSPTPMTSWWIVWEPSVMFPAAANVWNWTSQHATLWDMHIAHVNDGCRQNQADWNLPGNRRKLFPGAYRSGQASGMWPSINAWKMIKTLEFARLLKLDERVTNGVCSNKSLKGAMVSCETSKYTPLSGFRASMWYIFNWRAPPPGRRATAANGRSGKFSFPRLLGWY